MKKLILTGIAAAAVAATASADITGAVTYNYSTTAEDFGGTSVTVNVSDLYLLSDDGADTVLNVYNMQMASTGQVNYFQSATGTGWTHRNPHAVPWPAPQDRRGDDPVEVHRNALHLRR